MIASQRVNTTLTGSSQALCGNLSILSTARFHRKGMSEAKCIGFNRLARLHRLLFKADKRLENRVRAPLSAGFSTGFSARSVEDSVVASFHMARERILLIEDEPDIAEVLQYNLEKEGFEVEVARRGDAGLEAIRREPPDLLVLDLMLPGIDGLELTRLLKRDGATSR